MNGKIYLLTSKTTGKMYVGKTWQDVNIRMTKHQNSAKKLTAYPLYADMLKYGRSDFHVEILHEGITDRSELGELEKVEINRLGTLEPNGYNQPPNKRRVYKRGKEHHCFGIPRTAQTRAKISRANRGKKQKPETIEKIRQAAFAREKRKREALHVQNSH